MPNVKSASSSAQCWNHSWLTSPICFLYIITRAVKSCNAGSCHRNLVFLYQTVLLSLHYIWVKTGYKCPAISDLQGSALTIGISAIILEDSYPKAILKFYCQNSLDHRACHGLSVRSYSFEKFTVFNTVQQTLDVPPYSSKHQQPKGTKILYSHTMPRMLIR